MMSWKPHVVLLHCMWCSCIALPGHLQVSGMESAGREDSFERAGDRQAITTPMQSWSIWTRSAGLVSAGAQASNLTPEPQSQR